MANVQGDVIEDIAQRSKVGSLIVPTKPVARPRLNRQRVADVAIEMANEASVDAVSLRKLAQRLGGLCCKL